MSEKQCRPDAQRCRPHNLNGGRPVTDRVRLVLYVPVSIRVMVEQEAVRRFGNQAANKREWRLSRVVVDWIMSMPREESEAVKLAREAGLVR